jgi:stage II sporulation protein AB (anti-sigma F factor)
VPEPRTLEIVVTDTGVGIPDVAAARMPMFTTGGQDRSGMGFTIMERFMSGLTVQSRPGQGTTVTMVRVLGVEDRQP